MFVAGWFSPGIVCNTMVYMMFFKSRTLVLLTLGGLLASPASYGDYEEGVNAAFAGDFETAFREFSIAAEDGLMMAQYNLAILYFTGQGVDKDMAQAFRWTEAAAQQGHSDAQYNLASLYLSGDGVARDAEQAVVWFGKAALAGHANAAYALADLYQSGEDIARDRVTAHAWASQAVYNQHPDAEQLKQELESRLDSDELSQAKRLFARWQIQ
jgi:hypothetical protein